MNVADDLFRVLRHDGIADGVDQVSLAEAGAAIDEQRVVGTARVVRHLHGGGPGQVVGLADDQVVEGEGRKEPGFFVISLASTRFFRARPFRSTGVPGLAATVSTGAVLVSTRAGAALPLPMTRAMVTGPEKIAAVIFDARQVTITHPFQDEGIGRDQAQPVVQRRGFTFEPQWLDPGVELLCGQFLLEALQTGFPETGHGRKTPPRAFEIGSMAVIRYLIYDIFGSPEAGHGLANMILPHRESYPQLWKIIQS
jgi:hypothetical protein